MSILPQPSSLRQFGHRLLDALLPGSCLLCNTDSRGDLLCHGCQRDLPTLPAHQCPVCGEQSTHGERCGPCLNQPPCFDRTVAAFPYEFPVDRIVQALKYQHRLAIAPWLARHLSTKLADTGANRIIPLPLHQTRLRERGFNQSGEIARQLASLLGIVPDLETLVRSRPTAPQAGLALKERARNVRGAFECRNDLSGLHILLVDDVMTSGATLNEAARVLKLHGAQQITVAVAARAFRH